MTFRIFKQLYEFLSQKNFVIYSKNALRRFIFKLLQKNKNSRSLASSGAGVDNSTSASTESLVESDGKDTPVGLGACGFEKKLMVRCGFKGRFIEISCAKRSKKNRAERLKKYRAKRQLSATASESINRLKDLEAVFIKEFQTESSRMNSEQKETLTKSLNNSVFGQDPSALANAERTSCGICQNITAKLHKISHMKVGKRGKKRKERSPCTTDISEVFQGGCDANMTTMQLLKWVEIKIALLKTLISSSKSTTDDRRNIVDNILEGVKKANRLVISNNEGISYLIGMLEETALSLLGTNKTAFECYGIKDLSTLLVHLLATAGTKVTTENVQKFINGCRVIDVYKVFKTQRKPFLKEMDSIKGYISHGLEEVQKSRKEYREFLKTTDDIFTTDAASSDLLETNLKLKAATADLENFLNQYDNATEFLMTKAKDFYKSKVGMERLTSKFMTQEIKNLFKV